MGGGLMQLVAYGSQDIYLTGNPQITFFKAVYKRHTNFAMENIQQTFQGSPAQGQRATVKVSRQGDLVQEMYIRFTNPTFTVDYLDVLGGAHYVETLSLQEYLTSTKASWPAEQFISVVDFSIGGQRIDRHTREWFRLYDNLNRTDTQKNQYARLTCPATSQINGNIRKNGSTIDWDVTYDNNLPQIKSTDKPGLGRLCLPLIFSFNKHPGLALPLIALQYHEVTLDITFSQLQKGIFTNSGTLEIQQNPIGPLNNADGLGPVELWANYIYLDTDERRKFAQNQHEYLIEQLQTQQNSVTTNTFNHIPLDFNHPVKELVWCIPFNNGNLSPLVANTVIEGNAVNIIAPSSYGTFTSNLLNGVRTGPSILGFQPYEYIPQHSDVMASLFKIGADSGDLSGLATQGLLTIDGVASEANGFMSSAKLQLNGTDRFATQTPEYFNGIQPYQHHTGSPSPGVYCYSFALRPEEHQPSGTCNFSRIDNATLDIETNILVGDRGSTLHIYATNYNVLRIMSGMGGLAYSN